MQMRSGHATCRSDRPDRFTHREWLAFFNTDLAQVAVHRNKTLSMIDDDSVAVEEEVAGCSDDSGARRDHWRACVGSDIHAGMRRAWLVIEKTS